MAISANVGRDNDHNSTKLVCSHPLPPGWFPIYFVPDQETGETGNPMKNYPQN